MAIEDIKHDPTNQSWEVQKLCSDIDDYELVIEKQKQGWECKQKRESWKWSASYHGSIVASGAANSSEEAMEKAKNNVPSNTN